MHEPNDGVVHLYIRCAYVHESAPGMITYSLVCIQFDSCMQHSRNNYMLCVDDYRFICRNTHKLNNDNNMGVRRGGGLPPMLTCITTYIMLLHVPCFRRRTLSTIYANTPRSVFAWSVYRTHSHIGVRVSDCLFRP